MHVTKLAALSAAAIVATLSGCTAQRLSYDQRELRHEVIMLIEDQVMDNLVRAFNDDVMLHLDYAEFNGESSSSMEVSGNTGDNSELNLKSDGANSTLTKTGSQISGKIAINGVLKIKATPVGPSDAEKVYKEYRDFAKDGNLFQPRPGAMEPSARAFKWRRASGYLQVGQPRESLLFEIPNTAVARERFEKLVRITSLVRSKDKPAADESKKAKVAFSAEYPLK